MRPFWGVARSTERHAIQKADVERPLPKRQVSVLLQEVSVLRLASIACEASRGYTLSASAAQFPERSGSGQRHPRRPVADAKGKPRQEVHPPVPCPGPHPGTPVSNVSHRSDRPLFFSSRRKRRSLSRRVPPFRPYSVSACQPPLDRPLGKRKPFGFTHPRLPEVSLTVEPR